MVHRFTLTQASTDLNGQRHRLIQTSRHRKSHHDILKGFRETLSENSCERTFIPLSSGSDLSIRLVNGNGQCNGRVEILYNGAWGTVCDDYWDINAAQVVCRQLNCGQALAFNGSAAFGQGQGVIVLDDVQCTGNEQHVWDCLHQPFTVHNCGHNEDAGVVCSDLDIDTPTSWRVLVTWMYQTVDFATPNIVAISRMGFFCFRSLRMARFTCMESSFDRMFTSQQNLPNAAPHLTSTPGLLSA
ncbi:unnamed protein product [Ranitomeya imitator]|uniref:SRCR domain-containing protein n=1 Tax=Ranitomeya imitator TaxID=111125 RepID=A0ABN9MCL1_9NEOB|nr:unnamed protein product [Ranitomeya imitator]